MTATQHLVSQERLVRDLDRYMAALADANRLRAALESIRLYANDTLSGRVDGPPDAKWYAEGVLELRNRARAALQPLT
jgi:hypothetical protein